MVNVDFKFEMEGEKIVFPDIKAKVIWKNNGDVFLYCEDEVLEEAKRRYFILKKQWSNSK